MKKLLKFLILSLILVIGCKQNKKTQTNEKCKETQIIDEQSSNNNFNSQIDKANTIDQFLFSVKKGVIKMDTSFLEKYVRFPFEFKIGGEVVIYDCISDILQRKDFRRLQHAKFEKEENEIYNLLYEDPEDDSFFVYYYVIKVEDGFKLISMEKPH